MKLKLTAINIIVLKNISRFEGKIFSWEHDRRLHGKCIIVTIIMFNYIDHFEAKVSSLQDDGRSYGKCVMQPYLYSNALAT